MNLELKDRVAIVTGASKGLGAATARVLAAEGARLLITARNADDLAAIAAHFRQADGQSDEVDVETLAADLTESAAAGDIVAAAMRRFGRIDILVNCAGASQGGVFWEIPDQVWRDSLDLKFMATVRMIRAVIPQMRKQRYGRIVTIVGNTGRQPDPRLLPGAAANAGLLVVTKGLADEVAADGIVVNAVNPGPTRTERWTTLMANLARSSGRTVTELECDIIGRIPMSRLAEPVEIARLVAFLASDLAANMTGTSVTADGGWTKALA